MIILGIETSCDETAAAIVEADENRIQLLSNISSTSLNLHAKTGGVVPEIAAREQLTCIIPVIKEALKQSERKQEEIDAIAVTYGPGLIGSLLVGVETAKTLAYVWNKPIIPVHHLFGHIYANWISYVPIFPAIGLIVSGGHTDLILMKDHTVYAWLGGTRDDAAGEAIDKIGRELNFPYPAGAAFERAALQGYPGTYQFPRPLLYDKQYDFSFSGLKTAAMREIQKLYATIENSRKEVTYLTGVESKSEGKITVSNFPVQVIDDIACGVQGAIIDVLVYKTLEAAKAYQVKSLLLGGGVSANQTLRDTFQKKIIEENLQITFHAPDKSLCTDNAAMIAVAGFYMGKKVPWQEVTANPELYFD